MGFRLLPTSTNMSYAVPEQWIHKPLKVSSSVATHSERAWAAKTDVKWSTNSYVPLSRTTTHAVSTIIEQSPRLSRDSTPLQQRSTPDRWLDKFAHSPARVVAHSEQTFAAKLDAKTSTNSYVPSPRSARTVILQPPGVNRRSTSLPRPTNISFAAPDHQLCKFSYTPPSGNVKSSANSYVAQVSTVITQPPCVSGHSTPLMQPTEISNAARNCWIDKVSHVEPGVATHSQQTCASVSYVDFVRPRQTSNAVSTVFVQPPRMSRDSTPLPQNALAAPVMIGTPPTLICAPAPQQRCLMCTSIIPEHLFQIPPQQMTCVDPSRFQVAPREVSGGTATFFELRLQGVEKECKSQTYFIGKDVSHAPDEMMFYEEARELSMHTEQGGLGGVIRFMLEYEGVLSVTDKNVKAGDPSRTTELLVLRNLFDGSTCLRMMDIKIGQKTASAGWCGKSELKALLHEGMDRCTNSGAEGCRLAGFNGAPKSITSRHPLIISRLLDLGFKAAAVDPKTASRLAFSQMQAAEIFAAFLDVDEHLDLGHEVFRTPTELAEIVLHEVASRLLSLAVACRGVSVPQKWVGSSVALAFDCGCLPRRDIPEDEIRRAVQVNIFDWGRSELNTPEKHMRLSAEDQQERALFWSYYIGGVDRLAWEAVRAYWHRFGNAESWGKVHAIIYDFDTISADDFLCEAELHLDAVLNRGPVSVTLKNGKVNSLSCIAAPTLTYSVEKRSFPAGSRFHIGWQIRIHHATNLPMGDPLYRSSDPYVVICASSEDGNCQFRQQSTVKAKTLNPEWNESFELPVAVQSCETRLSEILDQGAVRLGEVAKDGQSEHLFPPQGCSNDQFERAETAWLQHLDACTGTAVLSSGRGMSSVRDIVTGVTEIFSTSVGDMVKSFPNMLSARKGSISCL